MQLKIVPSALYEHFIRLHRKHRKKCSLTLCLQHYMKAAQGTWICMQLEVMPSALHIGSGLRSKEQSPRQKEKKDDTGSEHNFSHSLWERSHAKTLWEKNMRGICICPSIYSVQQRNVAMQLPQDESWGSLQILASWLDLQPLLLLLI